MHGIRYIVIALGSPDDPATDEDVTHLEKLVADRLSPFLKVTALSERVSDVITVALLRETRAL